MPPTERAEPTCYCFWNGQITNDYGNATPCGASEPGYYNSTSGTQLCCVAGDTCGANSICHSLSSHSPLYSSFSLGGCTDPNFADPLCRRDCNDRGTLLVGADVVYDEGDGDGIWSCCGRTTDGTNGVDCSSPVDRLSFQIGWTPDQFPGPVGKALTPGLTTTVGSVTGAMMSTSSAATSMSTADTAQSSLMSTTVVGSATTTAAVSPQSPTAAATDHNTGLSTRAKAGIGVGTAVVALALLGMIAAIFLLWKKQSKADKCRTSAPSTETPPKREGGYDVKPLVFHRSEGFASHPQELNASPITHELDSGVQPRHMMDSGFRTHQD